MDTYAAVVKRLLIKINRVTSKHRHSVRITKQDLDDLTNFQIEMEKEFTNLQAKHDKSMETLTGTDKETGHNIKGLLYEKSREFTTKYQGHVVHHFEHREIIEEMLQWAYRLGLNNAV